MSLLLIFAAQTASSDILVTASRQPVARADIGVSASVIDAQRIDALGVGQAIDLLRLVPGVSVAVSGARGAQAQLRIRGAEANHSLVFVDGIRLNDPAGNNEARFEILTADGLDRIEVVRGPQSALWGSEALGGVIALDTGLPVSGTQVTATGEYGAQDSLRSAATAGYGGDQGGVSLFASRQRGDGIDIFGGGSGDRDGFENESVGGKALLRPSQDSEIGLVGRYISHLSEFDGSDPLTFTRADTEDNQEIETVAVRGFARIGTAPAARWSASVEAQYLDSANRNFDAREPLNRTRGDRALFSGQIERRIGVAHTLIAAASHERETFAARDQNFGGATDQDRSRKRDAFVSEWRAQWSDRFSTDVAVRHDDFNRFADETTLRAAAVLGLSEQVSLTASYGEGIAQPTFFDLYGFFPGNFVGNPALTPERSRAFEAGLRWTGAHAFVSVTAYHSRLRDEIVGTFDGVTFLSSTANATGISKRRGFELEGELRPAAGLRLSAHYSYLDADDQQVADGLRVREVRRPRHSASLAFDWDSGPLLVGGALAYVGKRSDVDFDLFPAPTVRLDDYLLASLRVAYRLTPQIEAFGRVENAGDADYRDVVGYNTPGRSAYAGLRLRFD